VYARDGGKVRGKQQTTKEKKKKGPQVVAGRSWLFLPFLEVTTPFLGRGGDEFPVEKKR
jgi:hypothetical protein